jgi:hypothetical protein
MLNSHERNQAYTQLLRPGAPAAESFPRKALSAARRLHAFNWLALVFFLVCVAIALVKL